ncbi:hypothetical protein MVEN_01761500 [Mycena venus]|uniref:Uncharacterized protein n=1 Tax=Mycena venus TaxID=2733690 RepID=A0A8H6XMW4_9AGAR|nr:hypothetical protein MVEN_01761500 [Mycena venus]
MSCHSSLTWLACCMSTERLPPEEAQRSSQDHPLFSSASTRSPHSNYCFVFDAIAAGRDPGCHGYGASARGGDVAIGTPCTFEAVERVIVATTPFPPVLVVLARPSLHILHVFPAAMLAVPQLSSSPALDRALCISASRSTGSPPSRRYRAGSLPSRRHRPPHPSSPQAGAAHLAASSRAACRLAASVFVFLVVGSLAPLPASLVSVVGSAGGVVVGLSFVCDGTWLSVVRRDGLGSSVWALCHRHPHHGVGRTPPCADAHLRASAGHTGAVIKSATGVGEEGHAPVRVRLPLQQRQQQGGVEGQLPPPPAPLAIVFIPAVSTTSNSGSLRSSTIAASPVGGLQDVLVFDRADGVLSLQCLTLSLEPVMLQGCGAAD